MKKTVLLLLTLGLAQATLCQESTTHKLDELMNAYCKVNKFNGSVLVARKGKILLEKGYGIKNARLNTNNDANSICQVYCRVSRLIFLRAPVGPTATRGTGCLVLL